MKSTPVYFQTRYIFLSFLLSFSGLVLVLYFTYTPGLLSLLEFRRLPGLFIALGITLLRVFFSAEKMRYLSNKRLTRLAAVRIVLAWDFASAVTPSTVGGAPMAMYAMGKEGLNLGQTTSITMFGVLLDQLWFVLVIPVLVVSSFYFDVIPESVGNAGDIIMFLVYGFLLLYATLLTYGTIINPSSVKKIIENIVKWSFFSRFQHKATHVANELQQHSEILSNKPMGFLVVAFLLSSLSWLARVAVPVAVILSFGPSDVLLSILRSLALHLAGLFVPTPGGSGGLEGLFALFMGSIMPRVGFIALALFMWRLIGYYLTVGFGAWSTLWYLKKKES